MIQIVKEIRCVRSRTIVICETPGVLLRAIDDIGFTRATTARPPANTCIRSHSRVRGASTSNIGRYVGNVDTCR